MTMLCLCGSQKDSKQCCGPFLDGQKKPPTAVELMRSRYTAFATKNVNYILKTEKLKRSNIRKELESFLQGTTYVKLNVLSTEKGNEADSTGTVTFEATYFNNGQLNVMKEKSFFKKIKNDWVYVGTK